MSEEQLRTALRCVCESCPHLPPAVHRAAVRTRSGESGRADGAGHLPARCPEGCQIRPICPPRPGRTGGAFIANLPDDGAMFAPEVVRCDADGLDIKFHRCPLKQAWLDANLPQEEVATLCRIAAQVDSGMFEGAGFSFHADTYRPGAEGCCFLHVRAGGQQPGSRPRAVSPARINRGREIGPGAVSTVERAERIYYVFAGSACGLLRIATSSRESSMVC